jgi:hypothetical protein
MPVTSSQSNPISVRKSSLHVPADTLIPKVLILASCSENMFPSNLLRRSAHVASLLDTDVLRDTGTGDGVYRTSE